MVSKMLASYGTEIIVYKGRDFIKFDRVAVEINRYFILKFDSVGTYDAIFYFEQNPPFNLLV